MNKQTVKLRRRKMPSGNISLYLDIYNGGVRTYEYLKLYLIPETNRKDKEANRQTMQLAEAICAKRLVEVLNGEYGFAVKRKELLLDYVKRLAASKRGSSRRRFNALVSLLESHIGRRSTMLVTDITPAWYLRFMGHIGRQGFAQNTVAVYAATMRYCINQAVREGLLAHNPIASIKGTGFEETNRTYLTIDEVRKLAETPCINEVTKRAFLFGCLTGLRHCDIRSLTWGDVHDQDGYTRIIFRQLKTKGQEYLDISAQAASLMGPRQLDEEPVFQLMHWSSVRRHLFEWAAIACISKHVTFHASRHTFAVMMLTIGTDIYTVSKLLGHRELSTTQVYAHVLDKAKRDAVDSIPDIL